MPVNNKEKYEPKRSWGILSLKKYLIIITPAGLGM